MLYFFSAAGTAVITALTFTETQLRAGGETIVVTLANDAFTTLDAANTDDVYDALGVGISSPGWDLLKPLVTFPGDFAVSTVTTTGDTLTFTLPAAPLITIGADEVLTTTVLTVPSSAIIGSVGLVDASGNDVTIQDEGTEQQWFACMFCSGVL